MQILYMRRNIAEYDINKHELEGGKKGPSNVVTCSFLRDQADATLTETN
jgi:hypothetical protein